MMTVEKAGSHCFGDGSTYLSDCFTVLPGLIYDGKLVLAGAMLEESEIIK